MIRDPKLDFGGDFGGEPDFPGPGDDDFGGGKLLIPMVPFGSPTWSEDTTLTLTGSGDVTTTVAIIIENASDLALDPAGKWQIIARTNINDGRTATSAIDFRETTQYLSLPFGEREAPNYGDDIDFILTVELISPTGLKHLYAVNDGKPLLLMNRIDNTGPVHGAKTNPSDLVFNYGATEQGVVTKSVYFDVSDPESGIVSLATPQLSTSSYGATLTYVTNVTITNGRRFIYNLSINGASVPVGLSASVGVRLTARNGAGATSSSSYVYATVNKADDSTGPVLSVSETPAIVLSASAGTLNSATYRAIDFNASDASGISSVTVDGNNSTSENIKYYGVSNLGNGNYRQTIYVTADKCAIGSSASFSYTITVRDNNGNATTKQHSVNMSRYDNVAPTFSVVTDPTDLTFYTSSGTGQSAYRTVVYRVVDGDTSVDKDSVEIVRSSGSGSSPTFYQGWSGNDFTFRWYVNSDDYGVGATATRESFYINVRDIHGNRGTSSTLSFFANLLDDQKPSISVKHVDSKTFYTSNNTGSPTGQTSTGYIYWSASDNVSVSSASGSRIGSTSYIHSVGSTTSTSSYGAQYRTSYVLISNFAYGSGYTARSLVRLSASDPAGNNQTSDVSISGRLIDNSRPYFSNIPASEDKTWYTSGGASQGFTFSKAVDVSDQHQSVVSHSVSKVAGTFTNVSSSLSGGKLSFSFTPGSNSQTANGNWVSQTVRITITDSAGNAETLDWTGRTRFIDNTTPIIAPTTGSTNEENCNFFKSSPQNVSRTVYFTVSDSFSAIDTGSFAISTPGIYYMSVSGISNHSGNTYKYTCTIPVSGKSVHPTRIFWGHVDVNVADIYGNTGAMRTSFYGSHFDDVVPSIGNVSAPAYNFTTLSGQTYITNTLTFRATDAHSGINTPTVSGSNGATAGTITAGSNGYYTCPVTVIRPGLTNAIMAKVTINVSDVHGNQAGSFNYTLPGSYVDNKAPQVGAPSGNSTVNFAVSSGTSTIDRSISVGVTDEIALSSITVTPINGAKGEVLNLSSISGTSSTATFKIRHVRSEYSANSSQSETYRITCTDAAGNYTYKDFSIAVNYNDDTSPIISNAATTISADFTESNTQSVKVLTYTFNVSDTGSGVKTVTALSDITITQPVRVSGTSYSMTATVDRGSFTHNGSYHNVGGIDIAVRDHANNISTHGVTVRAKLTDNVSPVLDSVSPSNVNMTTTGSNVTQSFAIGVSDSGAINSSSLQAQKTAGNGAISASFSSGKLNVVITNIPSNYTANNVYVSESYRVRIADDNGNYSAWRTIAFSARTRDTTPPTITSVSAPSFIFSESGASQLTQSGVIRLTDAHMGINVGSFNASMSPAGRGVDVDRMILTAGPGANEYTYNLTVNKDGQSASGSAVSLALTMSIQDNASNSASTTALIPVTVNDDIAPTITFTSVPSVTALSSQGRIKTYTVSYTVSDSTDGNPSERSVSLAQKGSAIANVSIGATQKIGSAYYNAVTVNASSLGHNSVANIYFTATASDAAGNVGSKDSVVSAVTVVDDVKPTISVSSGASNITLNNTNNQSQSVSATFLVSDDLTSAGSLNVNAHGASKSHSNGTVTLTKTFTYASGTSGAQELRCTVTDSAGNNATAYSSFTVNRHSYDLTAPTISAPTSLTNGGTNKVVLDAGTSSYTFTIAATIADSGSGVNPSTVKISSNSTSISGQVLHDTFNTSTGAATFRVTWSLNDSRWATLWSTGKSTVFSEIFTIHASDLEGTPYTNSASRTIQIDLARRDVIPPSLSISSIKTNNANVSALNPVLFSDIDRTSRELVISMIASDSQTNLNPDSWQLSLAPLPATGNSITYATANGSYVFGNDASTGLTVTNTSGNNYQIAMRLQSPNNNSILGNISSGGIPFGNSTLRATLTVGDNNSNSTTASVDFIIKREDEVSPSVGNLIARSGSLTSVSVSHSSTTYTHKVKVAASDSGSGLQSVTMNNSYVADSPSSATESGTLYYYFKRVYTFAEVWQDKHASTITVSGLRATARDIQGNATNSNSVNVVVTANDTENPSIVTKTITSNTLNMNTSSSTTAQQTFTVIIDDDDTRSSAVSVVISEVEGSGSLTLTNITGSAERRVFTGNYSYMQSSFTPGSYVRNWNIAVVDAAGNSTNDSFPEFDVNVADTTNPSISSVTIFNSSGQSVTSATLDTSTNTGFSGYIDVIMSDVHSSVNVSALSVISGAPVVIGAVQVLGSTKGRVSIAIGASSMASALGYGSRSIVFNVSAKDVYNNSASTTKSMSLTINDSTPPTISNVSVSNISMNYDADGVNDPADQAFVLKANVTDAGSGLSSVSASVTFNTGIVTGTNTAMSFIRKVGTLYEWRYIVSPDDLSINANATTYTFKINATPNYGNGSAKTATATAQLRDDTGPRLTMSPVEKLSGTALSLNERVDILTSVGSVVLVYEVTAVEKSDPITLSNITSAAGDLDYVIQSTTAKSVKATVTYTAAQVLALTSGNYNSDTTHSITMVVSDSVGNQSTIESAAYRLRVYDNQNPTVSNFVASDTTVVVKTSAKSQTIDFTAQIADNVSILSYSLPGTTFIGKSGNTYTWRKTFDYTNYSYGVANETYTLTVSDSNGNTVVVNEGISVTKIDDERPAISSFRANDTSVTLLTTSQTQVVTFNAVMSDNVAITSYNIPGLVFIGKSGNDYTWGKTYRYSDYSYGSVSEVFTLTIRDAAGNIRTATETINVSKTDNENPVISSFSADSSNVALLTSAKTKQVTFTADISDNVAISSATLDGGVTPVITTGNRRTWVKTFNYVSYSYGSTTNTFTLTVTDSNGNNTTNAINVVVTKSDDQNPSISNFSINDDTIVLKTSNKATARTITATISDNVSIVNVNLPNATFVGASNNLYTWNVFYAYADYNYGDQTETYTVTATDSSGNSTSKSISVSISKSDDQAPSIANFIASPDTVNLLTSSKTKTINITATISDNVAVDNVSLPGAQFVSNDNGNYLWRKTYSYDNYSFGSVTDTLTLSVTDNSNNSSSAIETVTVTKSDDERPTITSFSGSANAVSLTTSVPSRTVTFTAVVSDNVSLANVTLPGATYVGVSGTTYTWTKRYSYGDYGFGANVATDSLTLTATDTSGNSSTASVAVAITKRDDENPTINSFTVDNNAITLRTSAKETTVELMANISDNVAIASATVDGGAVVSDPNGGIRRWLKTFNYDDFTYGSVSRTFRLTVTDTSNNVSTASISVMVTKTDDENPTISSFTVSDNTVSLNTSSPSQTVIFTAVATDNVTISGMNLPGASYLGVTNNTYTWKKVFSYSDYNFGSIIESYTVTATDSAQNTSTKSLDLSVSKGDNEKPRIVGFEALTPSVIVKTSQQTVTVNFTAEITDNVGIESVVLPGATSDNISGSTYTWSKSYNYSALSFGSNSDTLTLTVSDAAGNTSTATETVTIVKQDDENPVIVSLSASPSTASLKTSSQVKVVTFTMNASDNVAITEHSLPGATFVSKLGSAYTYTKEYTYSDYEYGQVIDTLTANVRDLAGNTSTKNVNVTVVKADDDVPDISSFTVDDASVKLLTSAKTQTVTFTAIAVDNVAIDSAIVDGEVVPVITSGDTRTWTKVFDYDDYIYGTQNRTFNLTVTDTSANTSTASVTIKILKSDDESPSISSFTASDTNVELLTSSQSKNVTFTAVASDNVSIVSAEVDGLDYQGVVGNTYTWTKEFKYSDYSFGSSNDSYTLNIVDAAGNRKSASVSVAVTKSDDENPVISSFIADTAIFYLKTSDKSKTTTLTAVINDNVSIATTSLPTATAAGQSGNTYTWTKNYHYDDFVYGESQDMLTLTVTDAAGNEARANKNIRIIKVDDEHPVIGSFTATPSVVNLKTSAKEQTVTLALVASDNVSIVSTALSGATYVGKVGNTYTWTKNYLYDNYSYGSTNDPMSVTVTDGEGNSTTDSLTVSIVKSDDRKPQITSFISSSENVSVITSAQSQTVTFTAVISDNVGIASASLDGDVVEVTTSGGTRTWTKTYEYGSYSFGTTNERYNLTVVDTSGNQETASLNVNIEKSDDEKPVISSFTANNLNPAVSTSSQSQTVAFTAVISDNVNIASVSLPSAIYMGASGNTHTWSKRYNYVDLSYGNTEIVYTLTATDTSGNTSSSNITINVSKSDDQNPSVTNFVADNDSIIVKTSDKTKTVTFTANIADNVGIQSINLPTATLSDQSGNAYTWTKVYNYVDYQYGANTDTLTLQVIDTNENEINVSEVVTITKVDDETPVISNFSASDSGVVVKTSLQSKTVTFTANISDNVSIQSTSLPGTTYIGKIGNEYTWSKTYSYTDYQYGSVNDTLTLTVVDWTGNNSTKQVVVAVTKIDDQDPSILAFTVDDSSVTLLTSSKTQLVTFEARVSDNVNVDSVTLNGGVVEVIKTGLTRSWTKLYDYERFNYGSVTETFTLTVEDTSGNTKVETLNVVITKSDDESPVISSFTVDDATVSLLTSSKVQTVAYTAVISDNVSVTGVSTPGGAAATVIGNTYTWTKQFLYSDYSYGNTPETHTVVAEDAAGNTASASVNIIVSKIDNQEPTSTSISVDKTDFALTQNESTTITITAGFRDLQTGMSSVAGSAKVLLENGSQLDSSRIDSLTITTSNGAADSTVVAVINVSFDDLVYGDNRLAFKISAGDQSGNDIISDIVTINGNKYDSIPPEIISYKLKIDGVEVSSLEFNETNRTTAVLTIEARVKDNKVGTIVKVNNVATANISPIDGIANGSEHVWTYNLVNTTYPIEDVTNLSYVVTVIDSDGLTAASQSLPLVITRLDDIPPKITINDVKAIELQLGSDNVLSDIISGNNEFTIKSNPSIARHSAKLVINLTVEENNTLAPGYPSIHPVNGWIKTNPSGNNHVFTKIVTGADLALGLNNLSYVISAKDSAASPNTDSTNVTFIANVIDNTNPVISTFTMSGVPDVNGVSTILLKESESQETVTANFNLATSDNGSISNVIVQIKDSVNGISFDLSPLTAGSGNFTFSKTFAYSDFNLANGIISNLTMNARVEDSAGNVTMSDAIQAELRQVDNVSPVITYDLTAGYSSSANDIVLTDGYLWTYKSSKNANGNSIAYLKAVVSGSDPRGITSINVIATSAQGSSPAITMVEGSNGVFTGSLNYNALPEYGVSYTYQITATVIDAQSQQSVETKNISFNKIDDVSPTATLALVEGLVGGVKNMSTALNNDNVLYVELDVNENTTLALSNNPTLTLLGSGAQVSLATFTQSGTGPSGRYRYQIVLDKNDYQFTNLEAGFDQGTRIANESVKLSLADNAGNSLDGEPVELLTFSVELSDDGNPFSESLTYTANNGIQSSGVNSKQFNLSVNNVGAGTKIVIAAALNDNETNLNPDAFGINGFNASKSFNVATKTAFFEITIDRAFYDSLALYDEYETKSFTITFKDVAGNINSVADELQFRRTDSDEPVINSWTANDLTDAIIIHYDHHTQANEQTINVSLSADVSDERLSNMYYTTTKNGVLLPGNTGSGSWINQTFASVRPPQGSDAWGTTDNYMFKLYAVDANGATVSAEATLVVKFLDVTKPTIYNFGFMDLSRNGLSELQILTENEPDAQAIVRDTIVRGSTSDFVDTLDQMTIELVGADALSGNVITKIERLANVDASTFEFKVTMTTGTYLTGVIQPITTRVNITDRNGNLRSDTISLNVKISDNQAPVIYSLVSDIIGDALSHQNHVRATSDITDKVVIHVITANVYDETEVDLTSASFQDENGNTYDVVSTVSTGTYNASPSWKIVAQRTLNYDDEDILLGSNTITVTATVADVNNNVSDAVSVSKSLYKQDELAPTILAMGLYDDNATTVKDNAWPNALIDVTDDSNIDANGIMNAKAKSVFIVMNAHVTNEIMDQVLLEAGGASDESSLIMCIKNNRFVVAAGSNSGSALHNTSALLSFDMRNDASSNPLAEHMGSGSAIELALLVRLDVGAIILYVNGKLVGAAQANERNMSAWAGSSPEIAMGHLVSINNRNAFGPVVSSASSDYNWRGDIEEMKVYEWTSSNSAKVAGEAAALNISLDVNNQTYRGEMRFTCLDNEPDVAARISKNAVSSSYTVINGVVKHDVDYDYATISGTTTTTDNFIANALQWQKIGTNKNQSLEANRSMSITYQNLDLEAPVVNGFTVSNESNGNAIINANDIISLTSNSNVDLKFTINATDNSGIVSATDSFSLSVGNTDFTQLSSQVAGDAFSFRYTADWDDFFASGDPTANGDYYMTVKASVKDVAGNTSVLTHRTLHFRTTDNTAPIISSALFVAPDGIATFGSIDNNDYVGNITLSSANPSVEVRMNVNYTDNNLRYSGGFSVNGNGPVYTDGPTPRSDWALKNTTSDGNGGYSATIAATYDYNQLSIKNASQYRYGNDGNLEQLTAVLSDPHGNQSTFNFNVKIFMIDDVVPSMPQLSLSSSSLILQPGDVNKQITLTVSTQDNSNVIADDVSISVTSSGDDDISGLISSFTDITGSNPYTNPKVFSAQLQLDYNDITGPYSIDKTYTFAVIVKDSFQNTRTNNSAGQLLIQRIDNEAPTLVQIKRNALSNIYSTSIPESKYTALYNEAGVSKGSNAGSDLRFTIQDVGGLNASELFIKRSAYAVADATNPIISDPDFSNSARVDLVLKSDGKYEPSSQFVFEYDDLTEYSVNNTNKVYYQWWMISASDLAGNQTVIYMPWRVSKNDSVDPSVTLVSLSQTSIKDGNVIESTSYVGHSSAEKLTINITSALDKKTIGFKVTASDNHNIANVCLLSHPNDVVSNTLAGPNADGVYTISREYAFSHLDGYGERLIETIYIVAIDDTNNRSSHQIPVYVNQIDVTAPVINLAIASTSGETEIKYPGTALTLIATGTVTDANTGVLTSSVKQLGVANDWSFNGIQSNGTFQWSKVISWDANALASYTESFTIEAEDNSGNRSESTAVFNYSITSNNNIAEVGTSVILYDGESSKLVTASPFSVDPARNYDAEYVFVINDPNDLQAPVSGDITITGNATLVSQTKSGVAGNQTFTVRVAFDTSNFVKGDNNENNVNVSIIVRDPYDQAGVFDIDQKWYVWNYDTIDLDVDYYYIYEANMNPLVNKVRNHSGAITGYSMNAISGTFSGLQRIAMNLPSGSKEISLEPFIVEQREEDQPDVVKSSWTFDLDSIVTANNQGVVEATIEIEDKSIDISYIDDYSMAQVIYSNYDQVGVDVDGNPIGQSYIPTVEANTADNLYRQIDKDYLMSNPAISGSINARALNFLRSDAPGVSAVTLAPIPVGERLDQLAHRNNLFGQESIIETGQYFVLNGTVKYSVVVNDANSVAHTVVSEQPVKLVIKHKPGIATIN
uniref:Cadherin domain-containing protein n=1 Tax=viral metagenome TaxID=1070528 RepID=A0A6C0LJW8_9ZZZZ